MYCLGFNQSFQRSRREPSGSFFVEIMSQGSAYFGILSGVYGFLNRNYKGGDCSGTKNVTKTIDKRQLSICNRQFANRTSAYGSRIKELRTTSSPLGTEVKIGKLRGIIITKAFPQLRKGLFWGSTRSHIVKSMGNYCWGLHWSCTGVALTCSVQCNPGATWVAGFALIWP
jgi:hypothetical protein